MPTSPEPQNAPDAPVTVSQVDWSMLLDLLGAYRQAAHVARSALIGGSSDEGVKAAQAALTRIDRVDAAAHPMDDKAFDDAFHRICIAYRVKAAYLRVDPEPLLKKRMRLKSGGNAEVQSALDAAVQAAPGVNAGRARMSAEQATSAIKSLLERHSQRAGKGA